MSNSNQGNRQRRQRRRQRIPPFHRRSKTELTEDQADSGKSTAEQLFEQCERTKEKLVSPTANQSAIWLYRQEFLDKYQQLVLFDLDFAIEKKLEQDLWTIIFKNDMTQKQEQLKIHQNNQIKRTEIQTSLQILYEYARGFYLKLLQDIVQRYNYKTSICKSNIFYPSKTKFNGQCKEASILYLVQHILVHVGDLNRYSNKIDLAKIFYEYAIETFPCFGQAYNQIAIVHDMKSSSSSLTSGENQLIAGFFYVRSIAIKVAFPLAISNLEKFFQRAEQKQISGNEFLSSFLQLVSLINLDRNTPQIVNLTEIFRLNLLNNFHLENLIKIVTILIFTAHRALAYLPRPNGSNKPSEEKFQSTLNLFLIVIEQLLETSQLSLPIVNVEENQILPILYLCFSYLSNIQKTKIELFNQEAFRKSAMWNSLAKLLRSFAVSARNFQPNKDENISLFNQYADYPLPEERILECFSPLNDHLKVYNFKKYQPIRKQLSEKDERQLRKLRFVFIMKQLCLKFDYLLSYVKDDLIYFESKKAIVQEIPSSNFGAPGDRRSLQKPTEDEKRTPNPGRTARGARNVALRQFLEPNSNAQESNSNSTNRCESWPALTQSKDIFQNRTIDDDSHMNTVWSNQNTSSTSFNPSTLPTNVIFPDRSTKQ